MKTKRYSSSNHHGHLTLTAVVLNYFRSTSHAPPATSFVNQGVAIVSGMTSISRRQRRSSGNARKASSLGSAYAVRNTAPTHPPCGDLRLDVTKVYSKRRAVREYTSYVFISDLVGKECRALLFLHSTRKKCNRFQESVYWAIR